MNDFSDTMVVILIVCLGLAFIGVPLGIGLSILQPLDRAAKNRKAPIRFTMLDVLGLFFLIQIPMGLIHSLVHTHERSMLLTLDGCSWMATVSIWWFGVRTFSRAGIDDVWQRGILVFVALPMAYMGSFAIVILPLLLFYGMLDYVWQYALVTVIEVALIIAAIFSISFTRRITHGKHSLWTKLFAVRLQNPPTSD